MGFRVQGSGFRVQGPGFRVQGFGFKVQGSRFRVWGSGCLARAMLCAILCYPMYLSHMTTTHPGGPASRALWWSLRVGRCPALAMNCAIRTSVRMKRRPHRRQTVEFITSSYWILCVGGCKGREGSRVLSARRAQVHLRRGERLRASSLITAC